MSNLFINNLTSNNASFTYLNIFNTQQNANIINGTFSNVSTTNLTGTNATITSLNVSNEVATNITTTTLNVSNEVATNITATTLNVSNEVATNITTTTLNVSNEVATNITTTSLNIVNVGKVVMTSSSWSVGSGASNVGIYLSTTAISKTGLDFCSISNHTGTGLAVTCNYSGIYSCTIGVNNSTTGYVWMDRNQANTTTFLNVVGRGDNTFFTFTGNGTSWETCGSSTFFLQAGDVLRVKQFNTSLQTNPNGCYFKLYYLCGIPSGY